MGILYFEKNISLLGNSERHWIAEPSDDIKRLSFISNQEMNVEIFNDELGQNIILMDKYDEGFEYNSHKKELIFILGINSIREIAELKRRVNKRSILIIIEPNKDLLVHTLVNKNLNFFKEERVILFADESPENLNGFVQGFFSEISHLAYAKNIRLYLTDFYRNIDLSTSKKIAQIIRTVTVSAINMYGNDAVDGLSGLKQNLENLKWLLKSKDTSQLQNKYLNKPAIVVAAGPSLNKNIEYLKEAKGKAVIIAVDTIVERLVNEDITPDFVCSVERVIETYDYFYKEKNIPKEVTLVAPPLLYSKVFEEFKGNMILPMRANVGEYMWLKYVLELENPANEIQMGHSCAHVAFGMAMHLGCAPIILIGQDLAYGKNEKETHASGTLYDKKDMRQFEIEYTEGYNEDVVSTTSVWQMFRFWYEAVIGKFNLNVINATEGGAKIQHTIQMPLKEAINEYCTSNIESVYQVIEGISLYNIPKGRLFDKLEKELGYYNTLIETCSDYIRFLDMMHIDRETFKKNQAKFLDGINKFQGFLREIHQKPLNIHNMQSMIIKTRWDLNDVEEVISVENLNLQKDIQMKMIVTTMAISEQIKYLIEECLQNFNDDNKEEECI